MSKRIVVVAVAVWFSAVVLAIAEDEVFRKDDDSGKPSRGKIIAMTAEVLTLQQPALEDKIPVNVILRINLQGEPVSLKDVRKDVLNGDYAGAQKRLKEINVENIDRDYIKQDIDYYTVLCDARLALAGSGDVLESGKQAFKFAKENPNHYRYFEVCELLGDLLVASGNTARARTFYGILEKSPYEDYKMRARIAVGQAMLSEGKVPEALALFEKVLAHAGEGDSEEQQKQLAKVGKARCLALSGKAGEATKMAEEVIAKASANEISLLASAYNTLGICLQQSKKDQEAMFAFLHVETLYSGDPSAHAEALYRLTQVYETLRKADRLQETKRDLKEKYPESRWAKELK